MSDEPKEVIEALERRVAALENIVRRLTSVANPVDRSQLPAPPPRQAVEGPSRPRPQPPAPVVAARSNLDLEQWFGQRALLAVGVFALLVAAAFFLKYAFDRGWISPLLRATGAIVIGIALAAWGHERILRGMRQYGAALIGAGSGLTYLGLWAAAGPYALLERRLGILLLAATTVAVTMLALHHELEGLAIWALGGAYLAPIILATSPNPMGFLAYLEVIGLGTGILAYTMSWRATFNLALFGYLLLAMGGATTVLDTASGVWLIAAGAVLTLHVTDRRTWPEARLGVLLLTWAAFAVGFVSSLEGGPAAHWLALGAVTTVFALLWAQHLSRDPFTSDALEAPLERFLFLANPAALLILAYALQAPTLTTAPEIVPGALAALYLAVGWARRRSSLLIVAFALAAVAAADAWDGVPVVIAWTMLALLALAAEREGGRPGGRHAATGLATLAALCLFTTALSDRPSQAPAFTDAWALALYLFVAASATAARWWGTEPRRPLWMHGDAEWMWILCGLAAFAGGSIEVRRYFGAITPLAGDLALSVWWLLYAAALVFAGFQLDRKQVRSAGLAVAAFAGLKIVFYDLSNLSALYRVGSFFTLAIIALAVAYAYNRRARASAA